MRGFDENNNLINFDVKENDYKKGLDIDKKKLILIILNKQNREEEIAYFLNENGYDILIADNHEEAIALTIKTLIRPNLIIIGEFDFDRFIVNESTKEKYMMSDQFATYLRKIDMPTLKVNEIPILLCESLDLIYECLDAYDDYDDYLTVPCYKKELLLKIKKLISNNSFEEQTEMKRQEKSIFKDNYSIKSQLEQINFEQVKNKNYEYRKREDKTDWYLREFMIFFLFGIGMILTFTNYVNYSVIFFMIIMFLIFSSNVPIRKLFIEDDDDEFEFDDDHSEE